MSLHSAAETPDGRGQDHPIHRWWIYQRERFPLAAHVPLVAAFSFSAVCYSSLLRGASALPSARTILVAFFSSLLFFLELRIADEFKDFEEDSRYRPYRPVPRGLVRLKELGVLAAGCALAQLTLALWLDRRLVGLLIIVWIYLALMTREFFVRSWLKRHPFTYLWTHMLIMPLVDFYVTACDWVPMQRVPPRGLAWFLAVSFFNGVVLELGRKIRAPEDEEAGVETYSVLWGRSGAAWAWLVAMSLTALCARQAAVVGATRSESALLAGLVVAAAILVSQYIHHPTHRAARFFEVGSGLWTLLMYLSLGAAPQLVRYF
jgi:4-hydroxybenzoate polyprenyltransferase